MGLTFTKLFSRLFSKKEMRILMVRAKGRLELKGIAAPAPQSASVSGLDG